MLPDKKSKDFTTKDSFVEKQNLKYQTKPTRRVLIVDDDFSTAKIIKYIIESYGNSECEIVCDPYEALIVLADRTYDFVFIDQRMAGLEGAAVLEMVDKQVDKDPLISETGQNANTPVVIMSGTEVVLEEGYQLKNFDLIEILNKKDLPKFLSFNFAS